MHLCTFLDYFTVFFPVADGDYHELANACDINYMFICSLKIRRLHV